MHNQNVVVLQSVLNLPFGGFQKCKYPDAYFFNKEQFDILTVLFERTFQIIVESLDYFMKKC